MKRSIRNLLLAASASLVCVSCNTFVGVGQDLKRTGEGVTNVARGKTWTGKQRQHNQSNQTYHAPNTPPSTTYP